MADREASIKAFCKEEKLLSTKEIISPSGRFTLTIQTYNTSTELRKTWEYCQGTVRRADGTIVCQISRNYPAFDHTFFNRTNIQGEVSEWLFCGKTYTSQCFVNLETGDVYDNMKDDTGHNFCWSTIYPSPNGMFLVVLGCFWACPYEFKFFDLSDPSQGWPKIDFNPPQDIILNHSDEQTIYWIHDRSLEIHLRWQWSSKFQKPYEHLTEEEESQIPDEEWESDETQLRCYYRLEYKDGKMICLQKENSEYYEKLEQDSN